MKIATMLLLYLLIGMMVFVMVSQAEEIDMHRIMMIESSGNPLAYNKRSGATGLFQITKICLDDYNMYHSKKYSMGDMFNPHANRKVAEWYLTVRIPQLLSHFKKPINTENVLISFNAGIRYVAQDIKPPKETTQYIRRYHDNKF